MGHNATATRREVTGVTRSTKLWMDGMDVVGEDLPSLLAVDYTKEKTQATPANRHGRHVATINIKSVYGETMQTSSMFDLISLALCKRAICRQGSH